MNQGLIDKVNALKHLPAGDKDILIEALDGDYAGAQMALPRLSIFRPRQVETAGHYRFSRSEDTLYYMGERNKTHQCVFFDAERKIEFSSRYYLTHFGNFLQLIDQTLANIQACDLSAATDIGANFVAIEKWFISYGHFQDEVFSLADFMEQQGLSGSHRAWLDYPTDTYLDTPSFQFNPNYALIDGLAFGDRSVNVYERGNGVMKLSGLTLVENGITSAAFHRFPIGVSGKIRQAVALEGKKAGARKKKGPKKVFITRSESYRDIGNKGEVEAAFAAAGYVVVNPENVTIVELIQCLRDVTDVAMYFGSAMTNMIYFPPGTQVTVLQSKSYAHESLAIWSKVIEGYNLTLNVFLASEDNVIDLNALAAATLITSAAAEG